MSVGDQVEWKGQCQRVDRQDPLVQQGPVIAVGELDALANAAGQGDREETARGANHQPDGLTGVAEDEFQFGVVVRLLMQLLDGRRFPARHGSFPPPLP